MKKSYHIILIRRIITNIYPVLFPILSFFALRFQKATSFLYMILMKLDWGKLPRTEWMDHDQDQFFQNNYNGSFFHLERGIFPRFLALNLFYRDNFFRKLKVNKSFNVLDPCSGDSYISQKFFFDITKNIVSVDLDQKALDRGKKRINVNRYMNKKHYFFQADIEKDRLKNILQNNNLNIKFDIILFNAAIEHFSKKQLDFIFSSILDVLNKKSFIFSYTIVEDENNPKYLPEHHEMFFKNRFELENIFKKYFNYTKSFQTLVAGRWNIYCAASNFKINY